MKPVDQARNPLGVIRPSPDQRFPEGGDPRGEGVVELGRTLRHGGREPLEIAFIVSHARQSTRATTAQAAATTPCQEASHVGLRILCVDDEPDILLVLGLALRHGIGAEVVELGSGELVLPWLEANAAPDLVVLDAMMPGLDGFQVCRSIRADPRLADIVVVFLTARALTSELGEGLAAGADRVLAKPFDPMAIGRELQAVVAEVRSTRPGTPGR